MISIRDADKTDIPALYDLYNHIGKKDDGYFEHAFDVAKVFVATDKDKICAFCLLNQNPRYSLYRKLGIAEIQDINVLPDFRRKGIATQLILHCENLSRQEGKEYLGISVGLTKDYGPAQILYAKLGYVPDGNGVTYDRESIQFGKSYTIDDDMALMLVKALVV